METRLYCAVRYTLGAEPHQKEKILVKNFTGTSDLPLFHYYFVAEKEESLNCHFTCVHLVSGQNPTGQNPPPPPPKKFEPNRMTEKYFFLMLILRVFLSHYPHKSSIT